MTQDLMLELKQALEACASRSDRSRLADEYCDLYGISLGTFWRWAKRLGFSFRKERADKGKSEMSDAELKIIAARMLVSKNARGDFTNSIKNAVEQLELEGFTFPVGYERICTLMKERGLGKEAIARKTPHSRLKSLYPNMVWQFDVTNCLQWHLDNKTGLKERDFELEFYSNKLIKNAKKVKNELLRFVIIDHCTGAFFFWYYYAPGERARDGADFFYKAFSLKQPILQKYLGIDSTQWQIHGVPKMLVSDKGSILKQKAVKNLMDGLDVQVELHEAGNPRAKGKVERMMRTIGMKFETNLKIRKPSSLDELNEWALRWCIYFNERHKIRGKSKTRAAFWLMITQEQLRLCPDEHVYKMLIRRTSVPRTVDGSGIFSFENRQYHVPDTNATKQKVLVKVNAYEYPAVDVHFDGHVWLCQPLGSDIYDNLDTPADSVYGSFRQPKHTDNQKMVGELEEIANTTWGVTFKGNKQKRLSHAPAIGAELVDPVPEITPKENVVYFQKQGTALEVPNPHASETTQFRNPFTIEQIAPDERIITLAELFKRLRREWGELTEEQNSAIRQRWPKDIPLTEAEKIINNIEEVFVTKEVKYHA